MTMTLMLVTNADQARVVSVAPAALYDANSAFISSISLSGAADASRHHA